MASKTWDSTHSVWRPAEHLEHDGNAWLEVMHGSEDGAVSFDSAFMPDSYMGQGTILQRDISQMPVHPDSEAMSQYMDKWSTFTPAGGWGAKTGFNTSAYGTQPIHMYVVDSTHPDTNYREFRGSVIAGFAGTSHAEVQTYMNGKIAMPSWAVPAQNQDRGLAVYDKGTGIMREWFGVNSYSAEEPEVWKGGGGYSIARPGLKHLAEDNYALQQRRGISNVTGMHNSLGFVGISEVLAGKINHALCFTFGAAWGLDATYDEIMADRAATEADGGTVGENWPSQSRYGTKKSWPARAADGKAERYIPESTWTQWRNGDYDSPTPHLTPTHGQWGRLSVNVDPMYNPATRKPYGYLTRLLIDAAKTYGVVGTDTNLWCNAFNAEQGRTFAHFYGDDPWKPGGLIASLSARIDKKHNFVNDEGSVNHFPWHAVEWAPLDWGRPSPDFNSTRVPSRPWFRPDDIPT